MPPCGAFFFGVLMRSEVKKLPASFLDRLRKIFPSHQWDTFANTFAETRPTTFRVNTIKTSTFETRRSLEERGFGLQSVPWYSDAFILRRGHLRELQETEIYKTGRIYVQSLPSMIPPLILDPKPGELVLDLTAAPGSKTTQMACLMRGEGKIVANDNNKPRFFRLKANLELQEARNVELALKPGELFGRDRPGEFDRVLIDAPCSAEGRFDTGNPKSYRYWKPAKVSEMARKQKRLIASAIHALKPGGTLVYSTCTYAPEENEGVLHWALQKFGSAITLQQIQFSLANRMPGISNWEGASFHPDVRKSMRILPTSQMEGFFIGFLRKTV